MKFKDLLAVMTFSSVDYKNDIRVCLVTENNCVDGICMTLPLLDASNDYGNLEVFCLHNYDGYSTFNNFSVSLICD